MLKRLYVIALVLAISLVELAHASVFSYQQLDFIAPSQSLWGGGGSSLDFGASGSELGIAYDIGASSGTVSAQLQGDIAVDYTAYLKSPGTTSISLDFQGHGTGLLSSELGAWAELDFLGIPIIDWDLALDVDSSFSSQVGLSVAGTDAASIANVGVDAGILKIGASIGIEQQNNFMMTGVDGLLAYSLRGSGVTHFTRFQDLTETGSSLDVLLANHGTWDFWLEDVLLDNQFYASFDTRLFAYEEHVDGLEFTRKCVGRSWWKTCWWVPETTYERNEYTLADVDLYDVAPFSLDFTPVTETSFFSIYVDVPEPPSFTLMVLALLGLGFVRSMSMFGRTSLLNQQLSKHARLV